jgi:hypothetical protein
MSAFKDIWNRPKRIFLPHLPFEAEPTYTQSQVAEIVGRRISEANRELGGRVLALEDTQSTLMDRVTRHFQNLSQTAQLESKTTKVPALYLGRKKPQGS